jgi:hypothetical protein
LRLHYHGLEPFDLPLAERYVVRQYQTEHMTAEFVQSLVQDLHAYRTT